MRKTTGIVAIAAAAVLAITGCTPGGGGGDEGDQTLYVLTTDTSLGFDPATNVNFPTTWLGLVGRRLTTWEIGADGSAQVVPDLATDTGTPSEDGSVWTFTLKDDIFFETGDPITSADIKWGVERTYAPDLAGGLSYHSALLVGGSEYTGPFEGDELASIETPDDKTIVFHLTQPFGDWPWLVSMSPFTPVPDGEGTDLAAYDAQPVASGPYKIVKNEAGTETVLERNEFWDAATDEVRSADPDTIVFQQSQNPSTIAQSLIADVGDAKNSMNAYPLGGAELALVAADPAAQDRLITSDGGLLYYAALNNDSPVLSDPKVREAVQYAVDRTAIVLAQGGEEAAAPATTVITPGVPGYEKFDLFPENVDKAKDLLTEAGHPDGVDLTLWVANEDTAAAEALQQGLARADINVDIVPLDISAMYGDAMGGNPDYDMMLSYWVPDYPSANSSVSLFFESKYIDGGYNLSRYDNPEIDAAIEDAIATTDADEAAAKWTEIDKTVMGDATFLPLYLTRNSFIAGSNISDFSVGGFPPFQNYLKVSLGE
jgi:peptide/nickel transport system substrate-binding protein